MREETRSQEARSGVRKCLDVAVRRLNPGGRSKEMVSIRPATIDDLLHMQNTNLWCLPENYNMKYYYYHILSWPQLLQVAEDHKGKVVGYVLAKMEDEDTQNNHGHITSLSVLRTHRKCGLATGLMTSSHSRMTEAFDADHVCLHVRETNHAAFHLYSQTLKYKIHDIEKGYYADGENAYDMRKQFKKKKKTVVRGWGSRSNVKKARENGEGEEAPNDGAVDEAPPLPAIANGDTADTVAGSAAGGAGAGAGGKDGQKDGSANTATPPDPPPH